MTCSDASVSGTTLTYTAPASTAGQTGTITIPVTGATNYSDYNLVVTLTSVAKTQVTVEGLTAATGLSYTGSAQTGYTGTATSGAYTGSLVYTYYLGDGITKTTATNSGAASDGAAPKNAGDYKLVVSVPEDNETYTGSTTVLFTIAKATPAALNITAVAETIKGKQDGKITGVTTQMDYKASGDTDYTAVTGTSIENLAPGIYSVRYKDDTNYNTVAAAPIEIAEGKTITVTLNTNGGSAVTSVTGKSYNDTISAPNPAPTKDGYHFAGWYKDAAFTQAWNFDVDKVTDDMTLFAKWSAEQVYRITGNVTQKTDSASTNVSGATVQLKQGENILAATTTDTGGNYTFTGVLAGTYNIVVTGTDGKVKTELVTITTVNQTGVRSNPSGVSGGREGRERMRRLAARQPFHFFDVGEK